MATLTSAGERNGALDVHRFTALNRDEHPEVRATNEWLRHVGSKTLGYATWVPSTKERAENAFDFMSAAGHQRVLSPFCSAPIYFEADWEMCSHVQEIRLSDKPLDPKRLRRENILASKTYGDLLGLAREYGLIKADETASGERLQKLILATEFQEG